MFVNFWELKLKLIKLKLIPAKCFVSIFPTLKIVKVKIEMKKDQLSQKSPG